MGKKIAAELILFLMLLSLLAIPFNAQPVRAAEGNPGYIPPGTNVIVSMGVVTLEFAQVTVAGQLSVTMASSYPPPPIPPDVGTATASVASTDPGFFLGVWHV